MRASRTRNIPSTFVNVAAFVTGTAVEKGVGINFKPTSVIPSSLLQVDCLETIMEEACASERKQPIATLDLALQSCFGTRYLDVVLVLLLAGVGSTTFPCLQLGCDVTLGILHSRADCGPFVVAVRTKGATLAIHFACCGLVQSSQTSNAFNRADITREMAW
jgi:hypothetical protein